MDLYHVTVPSTSTVEPTEGQTDKVSEEILQKYHPAILRQRRPVVTVGDGNCMYRAVSKAMSGTEDHHILFRVLTALEILKYPMYYDQSHTRYVDLIKDVRIMVSPYEQLVRDVSRLGSYADMLHIYALSSALQHPIRSYYPPQFDAEFISEPYTKKVVGRGVNSSESPVATVTWKQYKKRHLARVKTTT